MNRGLQLFLEGPGLERRPVKLAHTELVSISSLGFLESSKIESRVEIKILKDDDGNLARQIDREGFRYKFSDSEVPWALIIS